MQESQKYEIHAYFQNGNSAKAVGDNAKELMQEATKLGAIRFELYKYDQNEQAKATLDNLITWYDETGKSYWAKHSNHPEILHKKFRGGKIQTVTNKIGTFNMNEISQPLEEKTKSQAQRGLIFSKRNKYGTKENTPDKSKWIWNPDWENKGKLPKKIHEMKKLSLTELYDMGTKQGAPPIGTNPVVGLYDMKTKDPMPHMGDDAVSSEPESSEPVEESNTPQKKKYKMTEQQMKLVQEIQNIQEQNNKKSRLF